MKKCLAEEISSRPVWSINIAGIYPLDFPDSFAICHLFLIHGKIYTLLLLNNTRIGLWSRPFPHNTGLKVTLKESIPLCFYHLSLGFFPFHCKKNWGRHAD